MASKKAVNLTDYDLTTTLGTGSFGRVMLCKNKKSGEYMAMKRLKKAEIIKLRQTDHVISENTILADIDHPFLVSNSIFTSKCSIISIQIFFQYRIIHSFLLLGWFVRFCSEHSLSVLPYGVHCWR